MKKHFFYLYLSCASSVEMETELPSMSSLPVVACSDPAVSGLSAPRSCWVSSHTTVVMPMVVNMPHLGHQIVTIKIYNTLKNCHTHKKTAVSSCCLVEKT